MLFMAIFFLFAQKVVILQIDNPQDIGEVIYVHWRDKNIKFP